MDKEEEEGRGGEKRQRRYNKTIVSTTQTETVSKCMMSSCTLTNNPLKKHLQ